MTVLWKMGDTTGTIVISAIILFSVANELVACMKPIVDKMVKILSNDNEPTDN